MRQPRGQLIMMCNRKVFDSVVCDATSVCTVKPPLYADAWQVLKHNPQAWSTNSRHARGIFTPTGFDWRRINPVEPMPQSNV